MRKSSSSRCPPGDVCRLSLARFRRSRRRAPAGRKEIRSGKGGAFTRAWTHRIGRTGPGWHGNRLSCPAARTRTRGRAQDAVAAPVGFELADDLRRWLRGEAIHAKPVTRSAVLWAWSCRNPALATVSVLLVLALALAMAGQTVANYRLRMALGQALLNEARLTRNTGRAGQRFDTLALVRKANETAQGHWLYPALWRTEVIAALAQPDFRLIARWSVPAGHYQGGEEFNSNLSQYAAGSGGQTTLFDIATQQTLQGFEGHSNTPAYGFRFSADGRWFSIGYGDGSTAVWSLPAHQLWSQSGAVPGLPVVPEFLPDSSGILTRQRSDGIFRRDFLDKNSGTALDPDAIPPAIPSPDGQYYLTRRRQSTGPAVWSRADGRLLSTGPSGMLDTEVLAWSPDSTLYATAQGTNPFTLSVVQASSGQTEAQFFDHELVARKIAFHPKGDSIASVGFDDRLVWRSLEPHGWKLQRDAAQRALRFSEDGRRLGFAPSAGELGLLELSPPEILHPWAKVKGDCDCAFTMDVSSNGRNLVTASRNTLRLWRTVSGELTNEFALPPKLNWVIAS